MSRTYTASCRHQRPIVKDRMEFRPEGTKPPPHEEIGLNKVADIDKIQNYGPFITLFRHLFHPDGAACAARHWRDDGHRLPLWGPGSRMWKTRAGTLYQSRRNLRPVLAFCGSGLDFFISCALLYLITGSLCPTAKLICPISAHAMAALSLPVDLYALHPPSCALIFLWCCVSPHYDRHLILHRGEGRTSRVALVHCTAVIKALLVAGYFMHLVSETKDDLRHLGFTAFFSLA